MSLGRLGTAALSVVALALVGWKYPPARLSIYTAAGRSPVCPWKQAIKADENEKTQIRLKDNILHASKLLQKDPRGFHLWATPHGNYWIPEGSDYVLPFNLAEQERRIYGGPKQAPRPGDVVLDCGANVGVFTRVALEEGARLVVAIEPAPENIECLRRNFAAEIQSGRVILYPKGVWDKDDVLTLNVDPKNSAADSFIIRREGGVTVAQVPITTIDKLAAELSLPDIDFIKMDIEGAEPRALAGAQATLARYHPRLSLCTYHAPDHPKVVPELVRKAWPGYRMECGPCAEANGGVRPDVLYFHP